MPTDMLKCKCMMCGHEYEDIHDDHERTCPVCRSNSIRQLKEKDKEKK